MRSKIMPCSPTMGNCSYAVRQCAPADQNCSGCDFLLQAFRCVMRDDIEGIVQCYRDTQEALGRRLLPASDVATRMRLSRDSKTYLAKRAKHTEAQYEALLAAGRTQWRAGERVRFYRSQQGVPVWLPDEADDASPISEEEEADEVEAS